MKQKTEQIIRQAKDALTSAHGLDFEQAQFRQLDGIGMALVAIAQEMKLANDLRLWAHGAINRPEVDDVR